MNIVLASNIDFRDEKCRQYFGSPVGAKALLRQQLKVAFCFLSVMVCFGSSLVVAQQQSGSQQKESQAGGQEPARTGQAIRVEHPPKLDGTLDDPAWQMASPITNFLQREPFEGQA